MQVKSIAQIAVQTKVSSAWDDLSANFTPSRKPAPGGPSVPEMTAGCRLRDGERHLLLQKDAEPVTTRPPEYVKGPDRRSVGAPGRRGAGPTRSPTLWHTT